MQRDFVQETDSELMRAIDLELDRQRESLELIASENFTSPAVMAVQGSILTNKYAEGYPDIRYYGGCTYVDMVEKLAIERAQELFRSDYANVQPHSGSQANMAAFFAFLEPGDTVLSMSLAHGGHLTHGSTVSFSGKFYNFIHYEVDPDSGTIDYDAVEHLAKLHKPKMILAGASAYSRIINFAAFADIAEQVGAYLMVDMAHIAGLVAAGIHPSPVPYAHVVTSTTHKTLRGPRGGLVLARNEYRKPLNSTVFPGIQGGPLVHVIGAKALAFKEALTEDFRLYQQQVVKNAKTLGEKLVENGVNIISGGTDNHLLLVDLQNLDITGKDAEHVLEKAGITVNKNAIPFDPQPPKITSGIRIGTPAVTTRGMQEAEMDTVANLIIRVLKNPEDQKVIEKTGEEVKELCKAFPLYPYF